MPGVHYCLNCEMLYSTSATWRSTTVCDAWCSEQYAQRYAGN